MEEHINVKYTIDARGYYCPVPMISTLKVLSRMNSGECLQIKVNDDTYIHDLQKLEKTGKIKILDATEDEFETFCILKCK